jgi:hypothetical protein
LKIFSQCAKPNIEIQTEPHFVPKSKSSFNVKPPPFNINQTERGSLSAKPADGRYDLKRWNKKQPV